MYNVVVVVVVGVVMVQYYLVRVLLVLSFVSRVGLVIGITTKR